jgi:GT2 family glycosyltransferase
LVDNGSSDGTLAAVAEHFPEVECIANPTNLGFAAGCNVGLRYALDQGADFVFIANNDTVVAPNLLTEVVAAAVPTDVGIVAPLVYYAADPQRIWSAGAGRNPLTLEMSGNLRGQIDKGIWPEVLEREYVVGCGLLLKRELLDRVGLFDPRFFMYYEDLDLCLRARAAGFRILLAPRAHMWHRVAVSSGGTDTPAERYWAARSSVQFFRKHVHGLRWLVVAPYRMGSAVKTTLRLLSRGRWEAAWAYIRGLWDGWTAD